jgi:hypothetical protein
MRKIREARIVFTPRTRAGIEALSPLLHGEIPVRELWESLPTEHLFAFIIGWHFRAIRLRERVGFAECRTEYLKRCSLMGPESSPEDAERFAHSLAHNEYAGDMGETNVLMVQGLKPDWLETLHLRVLTQYLWAKRQMAELEVDRSHSCQNMWDEGIIDGFVSGIANESDSVESDEQLLTDCEIFLSRRINAIYQRQNSDFDPSDWHDSQSLSVEAHLWSLQGRTGAKGFTADGDGDQPNDVLTYLRKHHLSTTDEFWTHDRVRRAIRLGME